MAEPHIGELFGDPAPNKNNIPYKNVQNQSIPPASPKPPLSNNTPKPNIVQNGKEYWYSVNSNYLASYNTGIIIGTITAKPNLDDFFNQLSLAIEEGYRKELQKQNKTTEHLKNNYEMAKLSLKVLHKAATVPNMDPNNIIALIHGFINAYITSISNEN